MDDENETDLEETEEDGDMDREMDGDTEDIEGEGDDESMHEVEREEASSERHRIRLGEACRRRGFTGFHNHCTYLYVYCMLFLRKILFVHKMAMEYEG